jgi:hypothetical protein
MTERLTPSKGSATCASGLPGGGGVDLRENAGVHVSFMARAMPSSSSDTSWRTRITGAMSACKNHARRP